MQIKCDKKVCFTPNQFYESKELYLEGAEKILSVQAQSRTVSLEALMGEVRTAYMLTIRSIYLDQDGLIVKKEESFDLSSTLRGNITVNSHACVSTCVIGVEYQGMQNLKVRVMLEQRGFYIQPICFEPCDKEEIAYKRNTATIKQALPLRSAEFIIDKTEIVNKGVGNVLCTDATICAKKVSTATDICEIEGIATVHYCHLHEGEMEGNSLTFPFSYELLAEGVKGGDEISLWIAPVSTSLTVTELDNGSELAIQVLAEIKGYIERACEIDYPVDAYSKVNELSLGQGEVVVCERGCNIKSTERFSTSLPIEEITDAVEIVSVGVPWVGATNVIAKPSVVVEGVICSEVLLKREIGEYARVLAEIPYSFDLKEDITCSSDLEARIEIIDLTARIRFGATLELSGEVLVRVNGSTERVISYLEKVEPIGERIKNDAIISVYLVGEGETLFDCAKALQSDEEELLALNPDLDLPLKEGDKVLLYRPL